MAQNFSPNDLVIYSFEALEAWAFEQNLARSPHETPAEFVARFGQARADLRQDATRLAGYFVTIVYGQRGFKTEVLPPLRVLAGDFRGCPHEPPVQAGCRSACARQSPSASRSRRPPRIRE